MSGHPAPMARAVAFRRMLRPIERVCTVVFLSVVSGAYLPFVARRLGVGDDEAASASLAHIALLPLYAGLAALIATHPREFGRAVWRGKLALALVFLAGTSTLWSLLPDLTLARSISLLAPTAVGLMLSARFTPRELLRLLAWALGLAAVLSALVALALPADGISSIEYGEAWHGIYRNKNGLGRAMALGMAVFVLLALDSGRDRLLYWLAAAGCLGLVIMARAAASLVVCVALLTLIPLFRALRLRLTASAGVWTVAALMAAIVATLVVSNAEFAFALMGRDTTLTGRTDIWAAVAASIAQRPWLGYGYNAFWQEWSGPSAAVLSAVGWETPHSHNGILDLWLDLGLVGVLTFIAGYVAATASELGRARSTKSAADLWPLVFLSFLMLINVSEAVVLKQHNLFWVLYVAALSAPQLARAPVREARPAFEAGGREWMVRDEPGVTGLPGARGQVSPGIRAAYWRRHRHG